MCKVRNTIFTTFLYADLICYDEAILLSPISPPKIKIIDMGFFHITFILHKSQ